MATHHIRAGVRRLLRLPVRTSETARIDADAELDAVLEARIEQLMRHGMAPDAARAEALRRMGAPLAEARATLRHSAVRRARRLRLRETIDDLLGDARFAGRQFAKARGFTAVAVLTLGLGIGATTALFSVVHRLLLAPLPYPNGARIVMPMRDDDPLPSRRSADATLAQAWLARTRTVMALAGAAELLFSVRPDGAVDTIPTAAVTANFFATLGVRPVLGRGFAPHEERTGSGVAMISHALWQRSYGGRPEVFGQTIHHEGQPLTIVGVTPPGLAVPMSRNPAPDVWLPMGLDNAGNGAGGTPGPGIFATLRPGVPFEAAARELESVAATLPASPWRQERVRLMRAQDFLGAREHRAIRVLFAAAGALLLIACANVANLLLARALTRQREFAVRGALGAGRLRLARQALSESLLLALAGGLLGIGIAWVALRVIIGLRPPALEHLADVQLNPVVLLWSLGIAAGTGILFGTAPALFAATRDAGDVLRRETRGGSPGVASRRMRSALIVFEIATSLVLLVSAGLLVRSFVTLQRMPLGFEPRGLVYADMLLGGPRDRDGRAAMREKVMQRVRALPGVTGIAIGTMPGKGFIGMGGLETETTRDGASARIPMLGTIFITRDYFGVARIALVHGRLPDSVAPAPGARALAMSREILVNRELERRAWPGKSAIGKRLREPADATRDAVAGPWSTVVGVVDDTRMPDVRGDVAALQVYSLVPSLLGNVPLLVRSSSSGDGAAPRIKHAIASADPHIFVRQVLSGDTYLRDGLAPTRFAMALLATFAVIAIVLAAVGLYGTLAFAVAQRTREIGVRVALGAPPRAVMARVMAGGLGLAVTGVAIGAILAVATTRLLGSMLYGVSPADPATFATIAIGVAGIALVASWIPARRALRINPVEALRAD